MQKRVTGPQAKKQRNGEWRWGAVGMPGAQKRVIQGEGGPQKPREEQRRGETTEGGRRR